MSTRINIKGNFVFTFDSKSEDEDEAYNEAMKAYKKVVEENDLKLDFNVFEMNGYSISWSK